ncbi:protein shisa-4-like [Ruditapes philippinarum]|uniref:protein shisa-4-like n=1 Tax=Ruditapes philippinarum TaxID=129788 RepID=UPI00295B3B9E|nr:protein shisa-4-like [Ruditapes philippinarum]
MWTLCTFAVILVVLAGHGSEAGDCCGSYTDGNGDYHKAELCADYCCLTLAKQYKQCCNDPMRQIPATQNQNDDCVRDWVQEHMWVPIVSGIVGLLIIIGICTCCCCCCCGCCRKTPAPVVIHTAAPPSTTVAMAATNQYHAGYDQ